MALVPKHCSYCRSPGGVLYPGKCNRLPAIGSLRYTHLYQWLFLVNSVMLGSYFSLSAFCSEILKGLNGWGLHSITHSCFMEVLLSKISNLDLVKEYGYFKTVLSEISGSYENNCFCGHRIYIVKFSLEI